MLGAAIRNARLKAGRTQEELALLAQVDRSYISMLENDKKSPTVSMLLRLAPLIGVHAWELVREAERSRDR